MVKDTTQTIFKACSKLAKVKANPDKVEILNKNAFGRFKKENILDSLQR